MTRFPRRLIEQLGDGHTRRLLESARSDEPPARLVAAAIAVASRGARASTGTTSGHQPVRRALSQRQGALVAGALLAGGMFALFAVNDLRGDARHGRHYVEAPPATTSEVHVPSAVDMPNAVDTPSAVDVPNAVPESVAATSVSDLPSAPSVRAPSARTVPAAARAESVMLVKDEAAPRTADLLREANRLRAQGRWQEAGTTYQRVIDLGPDSAEAYPAEIALGNLDLQLGRPAAAIAHYEHVLASRPAGILSEEARWGKARALRAAGRSAEERAALEEFRARHPDSPLAPAATQRLAELGP